MFRFKYLCGPTETTKIPLIMETISDLVESYVKARPFICTELTIINPTALSKIILPEIKHKTKRQLKLASIVSSLKKLGTSPIRYGGYSIAEIISKIDPITMRSNLTNFTFALSNTLVENQLELMKIIGGATDVYYAFSQGRQEMNLLISSELVETVEFLFGEEIKIIKKDSLASLTLRLPVDNLATPGVYYYIFQRLAWEGIPLYEVVSTAYEFTLIVDGDDIDKAFVALMEMIKGF